MLKMWIDFCTASKNIIWESFNYSKNLHPKQYFCVTFSLKFAEALGKKLNEER